MAIQYIEYKGIMVTVSKYVELTEKEKTGAQPLVEDITSNKQDAVESSTNTAKLETRWKPGLPTKAELRAKLDELNIPYTERNCWATLYKWVANAK